MYFMMNSVSYDEEGKEYECIDVCRVTDNGYEWVCECGRVSYPKSKENALLICMALNDMEKKND